MSSSPLLTGLFSKTTRSVSITNTTGTTWSANDDDACSRLPEGVYMFLSRRIAKGIHAEVSTLIREFHVSFMVFQRPVSSSSLALRDRARQ